jgi:isocitrate/isopropylmalate dehydrogenase
MSPSETPTIVVMQGDQTGQELLDEALRVMDPDVIQIPLQFETYDLSLDHRRQTQNQVVLDAAMAMCRTGFGLKAATITPEQSNDVGSPNSILRTEVDGKVIVRTGRRIPGVRPVGGVFAPITVVRMAVDDAYGAKEWRETDESGDEWAFRTEKISRSTCRAVVEYSFYRAQHLNAKIFGGPKYTVSPVYEGMFKEEMDAAAERYPNVRYEPRLIDATYALLLVQDGESLVIPTLNRDGDCMSDLVLQMFGTIAGAESLLLSFDENFHVKTIMAEAPHGTAPSLQGKNIANPMAMILACAALLDQIDSRESDLAARAIREAMMEAVHDGVRTPDIGGHTSTSEFTDQVIERTQRKLDVWASLGS